MTKIKHNIWRKRTLQTPIIRSSDEFFLLETNTVVVLVRVLIKPTVDVQVMGGFDASERFFFRFVETEGFPEVTNQSFAKHYH